MTDSEKDSSRFVFWSILRVLIHSRCPVSRMRQFYTGYSLQKRADSSHCLCLRVSPGRASSGLKPALVFCLTPDLLPELGDVALVVFGLLDLAADRPKRLFEKLGGGFTVRAFETYGVYGKF